MPDAVQAILVFETSSEAKVNNRKSVQCVTLYRTCCSGRACNPREGLLHAELSASCVGAWCPLYPVCAGHCFGAVPSECKPSHWCLQGSTAQLLQEVCAVDTSTGSAGDDQDDRLTSAYTALKRFFSREEPALSREE